MSADTDPNPMPPLATAAEGIYTGQQLNPGYNGYWTGEAIELTGEVDVPRLVRAVADTLTAAETLHTVCVDRDGEPAMSLEHRRDFTPDVVDLSDHEDPAAAAFTAMAQLRDEPADLHTGPLFTSAVYTAPGRAWWYVQSHHLTADGYSYTLLYRQAAARYNGEYGPDTAFGSLHAVLAEDRAYARGPQRDADREFWSELLRGHDARGLSDRTAPPHNGQLRLTVPLPGTALEKAGRARWPHRLMAGTAAVLHRERGVTRPVLGVPVSNRRGPALKNTPSMTMNMIPVPVAVTAGATVDDLANDIAATLARTRPHRRYRYEWMRRDLGLSPVNDRLFSPLVNVMPFAVPPAFHGCETRSRHITTGPVDDVSVTARSPREVILEANPRNHTDDDLAAMGEAITKALAETPRTVGRWTALPHSEPAPAPPLSRRLDELADTRPDRVAVQEGDHTLTYTALRDEAEGLAGTLIDRGVGTGDIVALRMPRGIDAVLTMLAVHYAGAAYLPLDPCAAPDRTETILEEAKPALVLTEKPAPSSRRRRDPGPTAYVVYTSGSTGRPKGVRVPQNARDYFLRAAVDRYGLTAEDRVLQFAPLQFDTHVEEVFGTLAAGACLVIRDESATESLGRFAESLNEQGITILDLPTAYWHEFAHAVAAGRLTCPPALRTVVIGGEAVSEARVRQWHDAVGTDVRLINTYGPTEATVVCLAADLTPGDEVTLGEPLRGVRAAVGPGGELYLAGPGLASGYVSPTERFTTDVRGEAWYPTGDLVRIGADGRVSYAGRKDDEVKISGHRIQPREVEAVLLSHRDVVEAAVVVSRTGARKSLTAYVSGTADPEDLRSHVEDRLPAPARPRLLAVEGALPRTPNGKIDHKALRSPADEAAAVPRNAMEEAVAAVFEEVLERPLPDLHADFFHCGGTSLLAVAVEVRLSERLERDVTASDVLHHPTIAGLAAHLDGRGPEPESAVDDDVAWNPPPVAERSAGEAITVTGGTGYVGSWILARLLAATDRRIHCLGRGSEERLHDAVLKAGAKRSSLDRLHFERCDLTDPSSVASPGVERCVVDSAAVVNSAAEVSLGRGYGSLRVVNTVAVEGLLNVAMRSGTPFHQVSTIAVGTGRTIPEDYMSRPQGAAGGYQLSKWAAEELVRKAGERGLPTGVHRLGRVVAPDGTEFHNPGDLLTQVLTVGRAMAALPDLRIDEPWIAVDAAAEAISRAAVEGIAGVWNVVDDDRVDLSKFLREKSIEWDVAFVPMKEWTSLLRGSPVRGAAELAGYFATVEFAGDLYPSIQNSGHRGNSIRWEESGREA
ncbi:AMP-binding protein [Salininema proteolyticum]|uniref:AMP-binding protein n=1 Tax=Salininema proteolyticum TaxID=1607685 RepID=A0ABV8TX53_9ACTN